MSKGSKRRPQVVDDATFDDNWNRIFCFDGVLRPGNKGYSPATAANGKPLRDGQDSILRDQPIEEEVRLRIEHGAGSVEDEEQAEQITRPQFP